VSIILIAYAEIRSSTRSRQHQATFQAVNAELVETMLALQREQLGALARRVVSDRGIDAAFSDGALEFEQALDLVRNRRPLALVLVNASGDILARSIDRSVRLDTSLFKMARRTATETRLLVGSDGAPVILHHASVRRGDQIAGTVWVALPIINVTREFFPDIAGLAFRFPDGTLNPLYGSRINTTQIPAYPQVSILNGESGKRFEAVFVPLEFDGNDKVGDLVLLRDVTNAFMREEFISRLTLVTVFVIILISIGFLTRSLRLGFRPLGAVVHLLEAMSKGDTGLHFTYPLDPTVPASKECGPQKPTFGTNGPKDPAQYHEIGTLLRAVESFRASIDAQNALVIVREQLDNARRIQQSLLPQNFDYYPELDIFGRMRPALEVAGDFFDIFQLDDGRVAALIADVSGKGLAPALFASQASALLRAQCYQNFNPGDVIRFSNNALCERNPENMFLTGILAFLNPKSGEVTFVNAGHCPPVIIRQNNSVEQMVTDPEPILGIVPDFEWTTHQFKLDPGDRFLLYSDGFDEAQTISGEMLGTQKLMDMFRNAALTDDISSERVSEMLFDGIDAFAAGAPQADDITIITIRVMPER